MQYSIAFIKKFSFLKRGADFTFYWHIWSLQKYTIQFDCKSKKTLCLGNLALARSLSLHSSTTGVQALILSNHILDIACMYMQNIIS